MQFRLKSSVCYLTAINTLIFSERFILCPITTFLSHISYYSGGGEYIYVHKSKSSQVNQPAQLLSPLIRGPKCLQFYYYMNGSDIGNLDVLLWLREQQANYLMWRRSGKQGDQWMKASVGVGYTGESQVGGE